MSFLHQSPQLRVIQSLAKKNKVKIYLVGGFLRDYFLDRTKMDFDFAVSRHALKIANQFSKAIKGAYVLLDEERGCARVAKKFNGQLFTFDFADFRAKTFKQDIALRDFTINTLAVDIDDINFQEDFKKKLIDLRGGIKDLKAKKIKLVSARAYKDDPLRMMRAFSLRAALDFKIEPATLKQVKVDRDLIHNVSNERVRDELFKVFKTSQSAKVLAEMDRVGLLVKVMPQIAVMYRCKQGGYHHLDVWPHSLEAVRQFDQIVAQMQDDADTSSYLNESLAGERTRADIIKLALLLHDIGKPQTRKFEDGKYSFHGHENVGRNIARPIAKMLRLSTRERHILEDLVFFHLRPGYLSNFKTPSERMIFRFMRDTKDEAASVLLLSLADQRATRGPLTSEEDQHHHETICRRLLKRYFDKKKEKPFVRLIDGNDLIKSLKLKPSPLFGRILKEVEEKQALGKIQTKEEALVFAKGFKKAH